MSPNSQSTGSTPMSRSLRIYQKVAIVFVVISLILLLLVLYLSISKATIRVTPVERLVSTTVSMQITPDPGTLGQVDGLVVQERYTKAETFEIPSERGTAVEAKAGGLVTLINETDSDQPLVATTRLLSEEGVLFRIDEAVVIPANGQLETMAHADEAGLAGEIGPTQFIVPGLPESQQSVIYAVSIDAMTGGVEYKSIITEEDLNQAKTELAATILEEAREALRAQVVDTDFDGEVFVTEVVEQVSDTEPGVEAGSFVISVTADVTGVFYGRDLLANYAQVELLEELQDGFELAIVNEEGMQVELLSQDAEAGEASLDVYLDGTSIISTASSVLDKERLLGRSPDEVRTLLESSEFIEEVRVSFTPFWLKRTPTLQDHLTVTVDAVE